MPEIRLTLPYPPTVNTYWRNVGGKVLISRKGRQYRKDVWAAVLTQTKLGPPLTGHLEFEAVFHPPDRRKRDIDNPLKPLLDSLTKALVYEDDSQIKRLVVEMWERDGDPRVEVVVREGRGDQ